MVKEPRAGRVKSRLGRDIGTVRATWWFRHQLNSLLRGIADPRWRVVLAVSPDQRLRSRMLPAGTARIGQGGGDLGQRMRRAVAAMQPGPVLVIGADIPGIRRGHLARAFAALGERDAVFGPAPDGGYWLTGFARRRALPGGLFTAVRWSGQHALADSIATLAGQSFALVDQLADIDNGDDLVAHHRRNKGQN